MINLEINKVALDLIKRGIQIAFFEENKTGYLKRKKPTYLLEDISKLDLDNENVSEWLNTLKRQNIDEEQYLYFSFYETSESDYKIDTNTHHLGSFKKAFIKETLIKYFLDKGFLIEPYKIGIDFCICQFKQKYNNDWNIFIGYDFVINTYYNKTENKYISEISISIGSENTYIGNYDIHSLTEDNKESLKLLYNNKILLKYNDVKNSINQHSKVVVKANYIIRKELNISIKPQRQFYKRHYLSLNKFLKDHFSSFQSDYLKIFTSFKKVKNSYIKKVSFENNLIVFRKDNTDYSAINGMRDYGPYQLPEEIKETQLLFIYPDSDSANKLFKYFSRGFRHFPGLETYVGIPAQPAQTKIKYNETNLPEIIQKINDYLPDDLYNNFIAICIMPFNKQTATPEQSAIYYNIKETLLKKNIPSQFIERRKIFEENFHYFLPNIAIALLAKLGGIPWKLQADTYRQLTIGFNIYKKGEDNFLGSAIYFDNEGTLKCVDAFEQKDSIRQITESLKESVKKYIKSNQDYQRLVIHYFKPPSDKEKTSIDKMLKEELNLNLPFAFVEINDSKTSAEICFDLDYVTHMPQSGLYIYLKPNEYLLFNNLRYWEKPTNPIKQEEYPIKIKIYEFSGSISHDELISQVYEFSRLYWKGLKQKAQPVTTLYSKLIAEYVAHFESHKIPDNHIAHNTIWFI